MAISGMQLGQYLIHTAMATFFAVGFMFFFHRAYAQMRQAPSRRLPRLWLLGLTTFVGLGLHLSTSLLMNADNSWFYHNIALFVLLVPFFYPGFTRGETLWQALCVALMWEMHHQGVLLTAGGVLAAVVTAALLVFVRLRPQAVFASWKRVVGVSLCLAAAFWLSVPTVSDMVRVLPGDRVWATVMYGVMAAVTVGAWARVTVADARHARVANYDEALSAQGELRRQAELAALFTKTQAAHGVFALASLDLDHFKQINARYGHLAGNAVLLGVSDTIQAALAQAGVSAQTYRTNGEELNIIFPGKTTAAAMPVLRQVAQAVRTCEYSYGQRAMNVTMSIGLTALHQGDRTIDDVYRRADDAVYKSKRNGRDVITVDADVVTPAVVDAKDYSQYRFFVQGVYAPDGTRQLHELLLRRFDADLQRYVLPDEFELPPQELVRLVRRAIQDTELHRFNLNLTAAQFQDSEMAAVLCALPTTIEPLEELNVEVTDVVAAPIMRRISALYRDAGIKIYIDDVGSDNSYELVRTRFAYVDGVKFAMQNLRRNNDAAALQERVSFWRQVAVANHLQFVLEGVETQDDVDLAQSLDVALLQGYHFGKPALPTK